MYHNNNISDDGLDEICVWPTTYQYDTLELLSTIFEGIVFVTKGIIYCNKNKSFLSSKRISYPQTITCSEQRKNWIKMHLFCHLMHYKIGLLNNSKNCILFTCGQPHFKGWRFIANTIQTTSWSFINYKTYDLSLPLVSEYIK